MIKEVTREKAASLIPEILGLIPKAAFVSFDTELTGLCTGPSNKYRQLDTAAERYAKLCDSAANHGMWQLGLTFWEWQPAKLRFLPHAYGIYLWPGAIESSSSGDYRRWSLQLSSIQFLVEHGFDFNKALREGCFYLSRHEEAQRQPGSKRSNGEASPFNSLKGEDQAFLQQMASLAKEAANRVDLPPCNSYQRFLIYQHLTTLLGNPEIQLSKIEGNAIRVTPAGETIAETSLEERVGIRRLFDAILEQRLPLVGHNCWLDLMHLWIKFIEPHPNSYVEWKERLNALMPRLVDTKHVASQLLSHLESTSLGDLTAYFDPASLPIKAARKQQEPPHFHDAGYDSRCTGQVFLGLLAKEWPQAANLSLKLEDFFSKYGQRLHMMQSDYPYIRLDGPDLEPDRSRVLVVADFPPETTTSLLQTALANDLQVPPANLPINWVDQRHVMVILETSEMVQSMLEKGMRVLEQPLRLLTFVAYQESKACLPPRKRPLSS